MLHGYCLILLLFPFIACLYGNENVDNILPYNPPGYMPPMPPTDPPGYDPDSTFDTTPTPAPPSNGLRAPPMPKWTQEIPKESSGQQLKIEDVVVGNNIDSHVEEVNGSGSGDTEGSGSGDKSGTEESFDASGAQGDSLPDIMKAMDSEAEVLGVNCPSDIIFVIDATSSVRGIFEQYITYIEKVVEGLDVQPTVDHVGAIVYSSEKKQRTKIKLGEHKDRGSLVKAVDELPFFSGITATGQALKFAANHTEGRRENFTLNYVILTDGYSYDLIESGARVLREVPNSAIYAVSIGEIFLRKELEMITGNPDNVLTGSMSYGTLVKRLKLCDARIKAATLKDSNPGLVRPGEFLSDRFQHRSRLTANLEAKKHTEDFVKTPEKRGPVKDCIYDIGIIFDSSGSLEKNFQKQLAFAKQLVEQMPISDNATRVGIVQFAGKTKVRVLANFSQNKSQLKTIIDRSPFYSGTTFTNQALKKMAALYEESKRPNAKLKLMLFTDGYSAEDTSEGEEALKSQGVVVYTVGISTDKSAGLNMKELRGMATSSEHYYDSSDFADLLKHFPSSQYC
ncbi:VWFA domain-containing protein [Caenorhabditis elegans]|uniref:VWFA domain-containing protein n=1 Tax=Caenorhabditis elegans TaxID=6239 RepID=Q18048_CAEEL|nr:VWFA domain-containing protein [Caenorhabditis elegans]CCD64766.1 VWFA domain-containing protein [Caenorhabditis elegans]|eukprot:NP_509176.2 Uncharacterized protein CELE_C16E9.1 [Caenorhabditis elegans]